MPMPLVAALSAKYLARAMTSEGLFGLTGCAMALASGAFALYMTLNGPSRPLEGGGHDFGVFAQMTGRAHADRMTHGSTSAPIAITEEIDPVVTGSIPARAEAGSSVLAAKTRSGPDDRPILSNVLLRQIDGDNALVEMNDNLMVFKLGDEIPGAGRLVAMTRQGGRPALATSKGLIVESR